MNFGRKKVKNNLKILGVHFSIFEKTVDQVQNLWGKEKDQVQNLWGKENK